MTNMSQNSRSKNLAKAFSLINDWGLEADSVLPVTKMTWVLSRAAYFLLD